MESTPKRLIKNYFSLNIVQVANYIFPLITLPYIVRVIGPEKYGTINFAQAIIAYFTLVVLFSFDLSVTREVSAHREDRQFLSKIFFTVLYTRLFLFVCLTIPLLGLLLIPKFAVHWQLYVILFFINFGYALFPIFFYQGIEQMTRVALFNFLIKFIFTVSVFIFLRTENDYLFVPLSMSLGYVVVGIASCLYAIFHYSLSFQWIRFSEIYDLLRKGLRVFISSVTINLYTTTNTVLLGFFAGDIAVGYFSAAEKIVTLIQSITLTPLFQILFPFFSKTIYEDRQRGVEYLERVYVWVGLVSFLLSALVVVFAPLLVTILFGQKFVQTVPVLYLLAWLLLLRGLSGISGLQGLLNLKMDQEFLRITFIGMVLCLSLNVLLLPHWAECGAAAAWIITEVFIAGAMHYSLYREDIFTFTPSKIKTILSRLPYV